jgi:hypothetical protein
MAGYTFYLSHFYMGGMGEEYAIGLARINEPRDFLLRLYIFANQLGLFRVFPNGFFVAFHAIGQRGNARIAAVFPEKVAAFTLSHFVHMKLVVKINGLLLFLRIEQLGENDPTNEQMNDKADGKGTHGKEKAPIADLIVFCHVRVFHYLLFLLCCAHGNSKSLKVVKKQKTSWVCYFLCD